MKDLLAVTQALSDPARVRALMALGGGELCLCQLVELLGLAPATVSRHLSLLYAAGLVERSKRGRWHYYRLPGRDAPPIVRRALRWVRHSLGDDPAIARDADRCCRVRDTDLARLTRCYD